MIDLHKIRMAQVYAAEDLVIADLKARGLDRESVARRNKQREEQRQAVAKEDGDAS